MNTYRLIGSVAGMIAMSASSLTFASGREENIGFYTAVVGQVSVTHPTETHALQVKLHDHVLFKDVIQTYHESRTRAFFQDDSMLTVGENSRVEINEYVYEPDQNIRRTIVKLMEGQVRALVSKVFKANGSKFEVHTPSAVAAARGTYFTVWAANGKSGIINIGEKGRVDFTSGGTSVAVDPGYFSVAEEGKAPSVPAPHHLGETADPSSKPLAKYESTVVRTPVAVSMPDGVQKSGVVSESARSTVLAGLADAVRAVELTALRDSPLVELPVHALRALNIDANLLRSLTALTEGALGSVPGSVVATTTGTAGALLTGSLKVESVSAGSTTVSGAAASVGSLSVGSVSLGSTTAAVAPLVSTVSTVVAPVVPVVSTVVAPVVPIISTVVAPVVPVIPTIVTPVAPTVNTILATPPAVINGALNIFP